MHRYSKVHYLLSAPVHFITGPGSLSEKCTAAPVHYSSTPVHFITGPGSLFIIGPGSLTIYHRPRFTIYHRPRFTIYHRPRFTSSPAPVHFRRSARAPVHYLSTPVHFVGRGARFTLGEPKCIGQGSLYRQSIRIGTGSRIGAIKIQSAPAPVHFIGPGSPREGCLLSRGFWGDLTVPRSKTKKWDEAVALAALDLAQQHRVEDHQVA